MNIKTVRKDNLTDLASDLSKPDESQVPNTSQQVSPPEIPPEISDYQVLTPEGEVITLSRLNKAQELPFKLKVSVDKPITKITVRREDGNEYIKVTVTKTVTYQSDWLKIVKK